MKRVEWNVKKRDFFPESRAELFEYFVKPELLEQWCAPTGYTLKVPQMEARAGGKYRFEHTNNIGVSVCIGSFKTFIENEKMEQVETVYGTDGKPLFENLECSADFLDVNGGCEIIIINKGFKDERSSKMCEMGWDQCLGKLHQLLATKIQKNTEGHVFPDEGKYTSFY